MGNLASVGDRRLAQLEQYLSNYLVIPVDQLLAENGHRFAAIARVQGGLFPLKMLGLQQQLYATTSGLRTS